MTIFMQLAFGFLALSTVSATALACIAYAETRFWYAMYQETIELQNTADWDEDEDDDWDGDEDEDYEDDRAQHTSPKHTDKVLVGSC